MDRSSYKLYHKDDELHDSRAMLETYCSENPDTPFIHSIKLIMEKMHNAFSIGHITGKLLIDVSGGPLIHHLYSACEFFKEIILMRTNEQCIMEIRKWQNDCTGAFSWGHMTAHVTDLEGRSDESEVKEMKLKSTISQVIKFDPETESLTDQIGVPQADCVITMWLLDVICKDQDDYMRNLRKILKFLKPGGYLFLLGVDNGSYYTVGGQRFHIFTCDEHFVRNALVAEGLTILQCEVAPKKSKSDLTDYDGGLFIIACKPK
ncbi:nicotinamide N-methyltransferase-like [Hyperolius riggenbachi]|uniref:nicotinamide N-methyltransferase-like n=1 Tax=Hyperolius riggenbachi TaxID=752182 RepID=UPI0035A2B26E